MALLPSQAKTFQMTRCCGSSTASGGLLGVPLMAFFSSCQCLGALFWSAQVARSHLSGRSFWPRAHGGWDK